MMEIAAFMIENTGAGLDEIMAEIAYSANLYDLANIEAEAARLLNWS